MQPFSDIWKLTVDELTEKYGKTVTDLWFTCLTLHDINDSQAVIICDMPYKYVILKNKYIDSISQALAKVIGFTVNVVILDKIANPEEYTLYVKGIGDIPEPVNLADRVITPPRVQTAAFGEDFDRDIPEDAPQDVRDKMLRQKVSSYLGGYNEYTFDNFIVGQSNKFAHAACVAVANDPSCLNPDSFTYNPLFIYGPSGLGKTHLLYAIINHIKSTRPDLKIVYVKGEEFTNQLIDSISKKTTEQFREKYRTADVLLIDDIQFIAGRDSTQEEFFHTFNALYEDHKQIILTSDRPPRDIKTLEDRLKTRFEWGIPADIQPPDADLRAAIIKKKAAAINITLDNDVINFLAENLKSNIRQVEGAIKKLGALTVLTGAPITVELAKNSLSDLITDGEPTEVTIDRILEKVAKKYGTTVDDIKGTKRTKEIAYARHISIYLIRKLTDLSLPQIGKYMKRDHSTVISSLKTVEKELGANTQTDADVNELIKEIKG
ncbi:MAG: chromosomal replication initiator protein DnaA [Clostridia bacterium]|nr:chromosomal replication initiator protein DnaA [Clostridia bacterium]